MSARGIVQNSGYEMVVKHASGNERWSRVNAPKD